MGHKFLFLESERLERSHVTIDMLVKGEKAAASQRGSVSTPATPTTPADQAGSFEGKSGAGIELVEHAFLSRHACARYAFQSSLLLIPELRVMAY